MPSRPIKMRTKGVLSTELDKLGSRPGIVGQSALGSSPSPIRSRAMPAAVHGRRGEKLDIAAGVLPTFRRCDTPALSAVSSLLAPAAIAFQNVNRAQPPAADLVKVKVLLMLIAASNF
jgi:hypothetical protein